MPIVSLFSDVCGIVMTNIESILWFFYFITDTAFIDIGLFYSNEQNNFLVNGIKMRLFSITTLFLWCINLNNNSL